MLPRTRLIAFLALAVFAQACPVNALAAVELIASSDAAVTLRYEPDAMTLQDLMVDGVDYTGVLVERADRLGVEAAPDLPVVRARVAVPYCDRVELSVSTAGTRVLDDVRIVPAPSIVDVGEGSVSDYEYREGDAYRTPGLWPSAAAAVFGPTWFATQRAVVIEFYPCQTDPAGQILLTHEAVDVTLRFHGLMDVERERATPPRRETIFQYGLINYESAKDWRGRPPRRPARPTGDYFSTSDNWVKLTVREPGMYRIGFGDLQGVGIDPGAVDPTTVRVLYGGGLSMPFPVTEPRPDWMEECTILVEGEADGQFDTDDGIVFYALGVDGWADELGVEAPVEPYHENQFAAENAYWLTWEYEGSPSGFSEEPRRMAEDSLDDSPSALDVEDYRAREHSERNIFEHQDRSDGWFWAEFKQTGLDEEKPFYVSFDHVAVDSTGILRARADGHSSVGSVNPDHHAVFSWNDGEVFVGEWDGYGSLTFEVGGIEVADGRNVFKVRVPRIGPDYSGDHIVFDWFEVLFWRELWASGDELRFGSSGRTGPLEFAVGGFADSSVAVFKVIDKYTQRVVPGVSFEGGVAAFQDDVADTASYAAVSGEGYLTPEMEVAVFSDLRTPTGDDYIMIVYDGFYDTAVRLRDFRESDAGGSFRVRLVRLSDVYDEFSWGLVDPSGIRDYLKYTWDNAGTPPTHVLLIGDASLDYRRNLSSSIPCYIPTVYKSRLSKYWPNESWFVAFDADSYYHMAMALGRLPARSTTELNTLIDKIRRYEVDSVPGNWKNTAIVIGDDEYKFTLKDCCEFYHAEDAEYFARTILPWPMDREKIYLMEYERDLVGRKSETRNDLIRAWNDGALLLNFTGHGNEDLMAHEVIFVYDDISLLTNIDALPLYFAASCRLNKFDEPTRDALGELLVKSRTGGAIASIGSTRDSNASPNSTLNRSFHAYVFGHQQESPAVVMDVGSAFQCAFYPGETWENNTKFMLIGDPALVLAAPEGTGQFGSDGPEPLRRRATVVVTGQNAGASEGAGGVALVRLTDSADTTGYQHVYPDSLGWLPRQVDYTLPGETVYDGPVQVHDGSLSARFVVSSLAEEGPYARLRAYFYSDGGDGSYSLEGVTLADSVDVTEAVPPDLTVGFESGGTSILPGTALEISIFDEHGINLVDRDPEDGVLLTIDGGEATSLTDGFLYDLDSYKSGSLLFEPPALDFGAHTVQVSASDNMGNRIAEILSFEIVSTADFRIRNVANYPNPFGLEGTHILFQLPTDASVRIDVFTVGGRLIKTIDGIIGTTGPNQVRWDGRDQQGDKLANGVYLYRIHATSEAHRGDKAEAIGRAVVMR